MVALGVTALLITSVAVASAAPPQTAPGKNPRTCFGDTAAACTSNGKTATINTTGTNGGGGVYLVGFNSSFYDVRLSAVTKLSNNVSGSPLGIDPRWSIPIDEQGDQVTDAFAFVSFADCNNGAGLVDVIADPT